MEVVLTSLMTAWCLLCVGLWIMVGVWIKNPNRTRDQQNIINGVSPRAYPRTVTYIGIGIILPALLSRMFEVAVLAVLYVVLGWVTYHMARQCSSK